MPMRRWKQGLAAGILLIGAESAVGQAPLGSAPPAMCATPGVAARMTGRERVRNFFGRFEGPDGQPFGLSVTSHFEGHVMAGTAARIRDRLKTDFHSRFSHSRPRNKGLH